MAMQKLSGYTLYLLFVLSTIATAAGCKKNTTGVPAPAPQEKRLLKLQEGAEYISFSYNSDGAVSSVTAQFDLGNGVQQFALQVKYNGNKEIESVTSATGIKTIYLYQNGKIIQLEQRDASGTLTQIRQWYYQDGKPIRSRISTPGQPGSPANPVSEIRYEYFTVHHRNVREEIHYVFNAAGDPVKGTIYKYEAYESSVSAFALLGDFGFAFFNQVNLFNPVYESIYSADYTLEGTNENSYTYDDEGYTLTQQQVIHRVSGPVNTIRNITYIYK